MQAAVSKRYGPPGIIQIRDVPKPEPKAGQILVRVHATTVTRTDSGMLRANPFVARLFMGLRRPRCTTLGMDFAGQVEAVGAGVSSFVPGQRVFGVSPDDFGAHADYLCVAEDGMVAEIPRRLPYAEAVLGEGAWYANTYLQKLAPKPGEKILIHGASGAIGTAAVQLAKLRGAEVTAVVAAKHLELAQSLGADHVVDYTAQDFTQIGQTFDYVFDAVGKTSYFRCRKLLKPGGAFTATDFGPWCHVPLLAVWCAITGSGRVLFPLPTPDPAFISTLKTHMEAGKFRAVIDRTYPLEDIADAYRYVETQQKTGIVVVSVA